MRSIEEKFKDLGYKNVIINDDFWSAEKIVSGNVVKLVAWPGRGIAEKQLYNGMAESIPLTFGDISILAEMIELQNRATRTCEVCGTRFKARGTAKYCPACRMQRWKDNARARNFSDMGHEAYKEKHTMQK